jgi:hypothetical protein
VVIGVLVRREANFAAAEDAVQEAPCSLALATWPDGSQRDPLCVRPQAPRLGASADPKPACDPDRGGDHISKGRLRDGS